MDEENTNNDVLADVLELNTADDQLPVGSVAQTLGKALGKNFPDDATALKAVRDTFNYVGSAGKAMKAIEKLGLNPDKVLSGEAEVKAQVPTSTPQVDPSKFVDRETYLRDTFYSKNPQYASSQRIIDSYAQVNGISHEEAVKSQDLAPLFEKVHGYDDIQSKKSVLESNPRLGAITDKVHKARELKQAGDYTQAGDVATSAVLDAYDLQ